MNELENAPALPDENVIPEAAETATPDAAETAETPATPAMPEESVRSESETVASTDGETTPEEGTKKYFEMPKEELFAVLGQIVDAGEANRHKEVNAVKQAFFSIRKKELEEELKAFSEKEEKEEGETFVSQPDPLEARFKDLLAKFHDMRAEFLAKEEERRMQNLARKNEIISKLKEIASDIDNINLHIPEVRQLQDEFKAITDIPQTAVTDSWKDYQVVIEQIYDCLKMNRELRDLDFKKNLEIKRDLIDQAKALREEKDVIEAFKKLQALHETWRATGPVAKDFREDVWNEFKELSTEVNKRHQEFFESRKEAERANEEAKIAICEEIEKVNIDELKTFAQWDKATEAIKQMQERWKSIGFASRKTNNQLFARFRETCDKFFAEKASFYTKVKQELAENLARKIALCERAEALMDSTDYRRTADEIRSLQAEWKTIGAVPRKHSDQVWQRFLDACNHFFDARKKNQSDSRKEENENLAAKRAVIEELRNLEAETKDEVVQAIRDAQDKWQEIGHVPFKLKDKVYEEFREVINALREKHDFSGRTGRMNNFRKRVEEIKDDGNKMSREIDRLNRAIENKRNELKIYENNLGFLNVKSSSGNTLVKEIERRSQLIRDDIAELEKKIELLKNPPAEEKEETPESTGKQESAPAPEA